MGLFFPVYPRDDLAKLDQQKRKELATAIRQVLQSDPEIQQFLKLPEVQKFLKDKTWAKYNELISRP